LKPRRISQSELAILIGRSEKFVSNLVNNKGNARVDRVLAARLSRILETTPQLWINLQANVDGWVAEQDAKEWVPACVFGPETAVELNSK